MSLEAEDGSIGEDDESDDDLGIMYFPYGVHMLTLKLLEGFLEFEPSACDRETTHAHLSHEYERVKKEHGGWEEFIKRAESRARAGIRLVGVNETSKQHVGKHGIARMGPGGNDALLYRVAIKVGLSH